MGPEGTFTTSQGWTGDRDWKPGERLAVQEVPDSDPPATV
jgi:hypothetical protein